MEKEVNLLPHQIATLNFIRLKRRCLILSTMGAGKTLPVLKAIFEHIERTKGKVVYVCPAFLTRNIGAEINKWYKDKLLYKIFDKQIEKWEWEVPLIIMSYERMKKQEEVCKQATMLIFDECHKLCNIKSAVTNSAHNIIDKGCSDMVVGMTGTPLMNRVSELFPLLCMVDKDRTFLKAHRSSFNFCLMYQNHIVERKFGRLIQTFEGLKKQTLPTLLSWISRVSIRHTLKQIGRLPNCETININANANIPKREEEALERYWLAYKGISGTPSELFDDAYATKKAFFASLKVKTTIEFVKHLLESTESSVLVLSDHRIPAMEMSKALGAELIMGGIGMQQRQDIVREFQEGIGRVLVGTIGALGVGLTLTKANIIVFNDMAWTPAANHQAIGRILRLNQESDCMVYYVTAGEVDKNISLKNLTKQELINQTIEEV